MCYSAEVWANYHKYVRAYGADIDINTFVELYVRRAADPKIKIPKGVDKGFLQPQSAGEAEIQALIQAFNGTAVRNSEQELFKQAKRLADAERVLAGSKPTKKAANDQRVAGSKIKQLKRWISDGVCTTSDPARDDRIFPDWYAPFSPLRTADRSFDPCATTAGRQAWTPASTEPKPGRSLAPTTLVGTTSRDSGATSSGIRTV